MSGKFCPCKKFFKFVAGVYFSKTFCVQKWISFYHCVKVVICSFVFQGIFLGYGDTMWLRMVCRCYAECHSFVFQGLFLGYGDRMWLRMVCRCYAECLYPLFVVNHVCSKILLFYAVVN